MGTQEDRTMLPETEGAHDQAASMAGNQVLKVEDMGFNESKPVCHPPLYASQACLETVHAAGTEAPSTVLHEPPASESKGFLSTSGSYRHITAVGTAGSYKAQVRGYVSLLWNRSSQCTNAMYAMGETCALRIA